MNRAINHAVQDDDTLSGPAAPPLANGEIVFDAPWQSRTFAMARQLNEAGLFEWDDFRERLIRQIALAETGNIAESGYWDCFLAALQQLLADLDCIPADTLTARATEYAARPHGHDH